MHQAFFCSHCGTDLRKYLCTCDYQTGDSMPPVSTSPFNRQEGGGHYKKLAVQPAEFCHANNVPKLEGDAIYYVLRWRDKNGIADLRKAIHTIELLIALEEKKPCPTIK